MDPPNPAPIDMRHTKLTRQEAALISGELVKPSWASKNEGIHERISFEDTLWGFEMAGGAYYKTPLRVTYVRPDSRAEKACIRMGDTVLRISGQDTATLTLQEAHQLVMEAGINLKIVVTSPEDEINAQYDYQDPLNVNQGLTAEQLKAMEMERVRKALENASRTRQLPWPWVRRKWIIYTESNCFMVPSKYENKHRDKYPELPSQKIDYFFPENTNQEQNTKNVKDNANKAKENEASKKSENINSDEELVEGVEKETKLQNENKEVKEEKTHEKEASMKSENKNNDVELEEGVEKEEKLQNENKDVKEERTHENEASIKSENKNNDEEVEEGVEKEEKLQNENKEVKEEITYENEASKKSENKNNDEELEEGVEKEEKLQNEDKEVKDEGTNESLEAESIENLDDAIDQKDYDVEENTEINLSKMEQKVHNSNLQKDTEGSVSNKDVDNNINHVEKNKDENNKVSQDIEQNSDDNIINEIVQNSSGILDDIENVPKSDDDIIDSVLNDIVDSNDSQNES